jgi:uncharacterized protein (TIGR02594 family)
VNVTAFDVAKKFLGVEEVEGMTSNPLVLGMLQLDAKWVREDSTPWCSAFANFIAFLLGLPRSKSLAARSWLKVGTPIELFEARQENDVVVLKRGGGNQPGPEVLAAPGHIGFFAGRAPGEVLLLAGNQGNQVSIARFHADQVLGVRRLA